MRGLDWEGNPRVLSDENPHPFPVTMDLLAEAIKRLRAVESENVEGTITLWRGLRNVTLPTEFLQNGGSEKAPMSTTRDLCVAVQYSPSGCAILLKLVVESFHQLGVRRCISILRDICQMPSSSLWSAGCCWLTWRSSRLRTGRLGVPLCLPQREGGALPAAHAPQADGQEPEDGPARSTSSCRVRSL